MVVYTCKSIQNGLEGNWHVPSFLFYWGSIWRESMKKAGFILVLTAVVFLGLAMKEEWQYWMGREKVEELRAEHTDRMGGKPDGEAEEDPNLNRKIDFQGLKDLNPDITGWIYVPETQIDYPVLKNPYDSYYLSHDYTGADSMLGSIFMLSEADPEFQARHTVLYGHNMVDGQMFGTLSIYADRGARDAQPYIYIYGPDQTLRCTVYSAYVCQDMSEAYLTAYGDDREYQAWLEKTASASNYHCDAIPGLGDRILTLSTCTDQGDLRFVVHAIIHKMKGP